MPGWQMQHNLKNISSQILCHTRLSESANHKNSYVDAVEPCTFLKESTKNIYLPLAYCLQSGLKHVQKLSLARWETDST